MGDRQTGFNGERTSRLLRVSGICGFLSPLVAIGFTLHAVAISPWFNWQMDSLSDLGVSPAGIWFNASLILTGVLNILMALGLGWWLGQVWLRWLAVTLLVLGSTALALVGVFTENYGDLHDGLALAYFILAPVGLLVLAGALATVRRAVQSVLTASAGIAALVIAAFSPHRGIAVPEILADLFLSVWIYSIGVTLFVQSYRVRETAGG